MARRPNTRRNPVGAWKTFGLPAFATILAPWQDKLTRAELIPLWYQPQVSYIASVLGPLVCFCLYMTCDRLKRRTLARLCLASLATFVVAVAACLWLDSAVDVTWFPHAGWQPLVSLAWRLLYLSIFAAFAAAIVTGLLLRR